MNILTLCMPRWYFTFSFQHIMGLFGIHLFYWNWKFFVESTIDEGKCQSWLNRWCNWCNRLRPPNKRRPHLWKYIYIYILYLYIYLNLKKKIKHFYFSIKCIKKTPLYPKMQKIKKGKNKNSQTSANKIRF